MSIIDEIAAERRRQIEQEGWTPEHDNVHSGGQMAMAAACYALSSAGVADWLRVTSLKLWPWGREWWKPTTRRRDLIKAGALIVAEIERLDREDKKEG